MKAALVVEALSGLSLLGLNVPLLLELMSWGNLHCHNDLKIKTSRTELMHYKGLSQLLTTWHCPPPPAVGGRHPAGACDVMEDWVFNTVIDIMLHELDQLVAPLLKSPPTVTAESFGVSILRQLLLIWKQVRNELGALCEGWYIHTSRKSAIPRKI